MTALADLKAGDAFILLARVTAIDVTGYTLTYYGPDSSPQGTMTIDPAGVFGGQLAAPPAQVPVTPVPAFNAVAVGDVLVRGDGSVTLVARRVRLTPAGAYEFSAALSGGQWTGLDGWGVAGHVDGL